MMTGFRSSTGSFPWSASLPASSVPEQLEATRRRQAKDERSRRGADEAEPRSRPRNRHLTDCGKRTLRGNGPESGRGVARFFGSAEARQRLHAQRLPLLDESAVLEAARVLGSPKRRCEVTARDRRARLPHEMQLLASRIRERRPRRRDGGRGRGGQIVRGHRRRR